MSGKPLKNPRHEAFARAYVATGIARLAYVSAGYQARMDNPAAYNPADCGAWRLQRNEKVAKRITTLRQTMSKRADITEDSIADELEQARQGAMKEGQHAAAVSAVVAKAKLAGLMIDRKEIGDAGAFERMTEQELREYIQGMNEQPDQSTSALPEPTHSSPKERQ